MKLEIFFRIITIFGLIAIAVFIANTASAKPTRPQLSGKVIHLKQKSKRPIKSESKVKVKGREFDLTDNKLEEKFWAASLEEKRQYPMLLRKRFVQWRRARIAKEEQKKNPNRAPQPLPPYDEEELAILKSDKRNPSRAVQLDIKKYGKVSNQSKIGNKTINLEVK